MIPLLRLLQHGQVLLQVFFVGPSCAVYALEHFIAVVTAPVSAGHFHQLEMLELAGAGHVGSATQVFKLALTVQGHILVGRNAGNDFSLVMLTQTFEMCHRLVAWQHPANHGLIQLRELGHLFFNGFQVIGGEWPRVREIVEKAVLDHGPDGDLRLGEQFFHCISQQVGTGVANNLQTFHIFGRDDGQGRVCLHDVAGINHLTINLARQGRFGQASANRSGNLSNADWTGKFTLRTVGKSDLNHVLE